MLQDIKYFGIGKVEFRLQFVSTIGCQYLEMFSSCCLNISYCLKYAIAGGSTMLKRKLEIIQFIEFIFKI